MRTKLILLFISFFVYISFLKANDANTIFNKANEEYKKNNFQASAQLYESILKQGYSEVEIYYNLGNSYFRLKKIPQAILNYERALKIAPDDDDIRTNLIIANLKVVDKIEPLPKFFLNDWLDSISEALNSSYWAWIAVISIWLAFTFFAIYYISWSVLLKKSFFGLSMIFALVLLLSLFFAHKEYINENSKNQAIIFSPSVYVKSSPDIKSADLFILHEGTKLTILDEVAEWEKIRLVNGNIGWIPKTAIEII